VARVIEAKIANVIRGFRSQAVGKVAERKLSKRDRVHSESGNVSVYLWGTKIVSITDEQGFQVFTGGYRSVTTKSRINGILHMLGYNYRIFQKNGEWFVRRADGFTFEFSEGCTITKN